MDNMHSTLVNCNCQEYKTDRARMTWDGGGVEVLDGMATETLCDF